MEEECQALAETAMGLGHNVFNASKENRLPCGLFTAQTVWVAKAVINTKGVWSESKAVIDKVEVLGGYERTMIDKWKFRMWCQGLGRKEV